MHTKYMHIYKNKYISIFEYMQPIYIHVGELSDESLSFKNDVAYI